jgi:hypothetical protein
LVRAVLGSRPVTPTGLDTLLILVGDLGLAVCIFYLLVRPERL